MAAVLAVLITTFAVGATAAGADVTTEYDLATTPNSASDCVPFGPALQTFETVNGQRKSAGAVCFQANGDYLVVADVLADGLSVGMLWTIDSGSYHRRGICRLTKGASDHAYACNKDFKENMPLVFRAGTCDGSTKSCRYFSDFHNVSGYAKAYT